MLKVVLSLLLIGGLMTSCGAIMKWRNTAVGNTIDFIDQKIDDVTSYETRKEVEDTCRASIASYEADKLTYEQYKDSESELERSWASSAKMRANKTASVYNNYILENSFVFDGNIPNDIKEKLDYLE